MSILQQADHGVSKADSVQKSESLPATRALQCCAWRIKRNTYLSLTLSTQNVEREQECIINLSAMKNVFSPSTPRGGIKGGLRGGLMEVWIYDIIMPVKQFPQIRGKQMVFYITISQDEDGMYIAVCPSIPGCVSQGTTEKEALANIRDAIRECLLARSEAV
jgi:predicted RNase H-like HicB family nuclease